MQRNKQMSTGKAADICFRYVASAETCASRDQLVAADAVVDGNNNNKNNITSLSLSLFLFMSEHCLTKT